MNETNFEFPKTKNKQERLLSSSKSDTPEYKKIKLVFITINRYSPLATNDDIYVPLESTSTPTNNIINNVEDQPTKIKLPPPIFIRGILDFVSFRNQIIDLIGSKNIIFKSSTNNLKI